ncbi:MULTISPECIES: ATPase domain-containing protein [Saccharibacillus]|uniref:ATPase domain-containing protein n=1 Tax=Saccharibacillus TaxID=456492 RepID=UPI001239679E|nr:ATPase domain-containing protein [Saccharibacillus sp. WB 17]
MPNKIETGIRGLDDILRGGLPLGSASVLEGAPGTGKTTLGMQFLVEGVVQHGEAGLYISFEEFPDQIYANMLEFGWDISEMERTGKMRVLCIEPEIMLEQMMTPGGLFEQVVREINCKRLVIDSISLIRTLGNDAEARNYIYTIRNITRKLSLTALFIREYNALDSDNQGFENYVCDGTIRLAFQEGVQAYRKRTLEVLKMRGTSVMEGQHVYKILDSGLHVLPSYSSGTNSLTARSSSLSTGIETLDRILDGGYPESSSFLIDSSSEASYMYLIAATLAERIIAGDSILFTLSSATTLRQLASKIGLFGVSLEEAMGRGQAYFLDYRNQKIDPRYEHARIQMGNLQDHQYQEKFGKWRTEVYEEYRKQNKRWFVYFEMNTAISVRTEEFVQGDFVDRLSQFRNEGTTVLVHCNFKEISPEAASFLQRSCDGVISTWLDNGYHYLQVTKSPGGRLLPPYIIENVEDKPYIHLV